MNLRLSYILPLLIMMWSCAPNRYQIDDQPQEIYAQIEDQDLYTEIIYVGATPNYHIFESIITNHGDDDLYISRDQYVMNLTHKEKRIAPYTNDQLIPILKREREKLKKTKKSRTILGAVVTGLGVLATATSGVPVAENILFNSESIYYIIDDRRFVQRNIDSVEDEIDYIKARNTKLEIIPPHQTRSRDILFPIERTKGEVEILFTDHGHEYALIFNAKDLQQP